MGLDNGVLIKVKKGNLIDTKYLNRVLGKPSTEGDFDYYDICYWRKCWNIREAILEFLHGEDGGETKIDPEDIPGVIRTLSEIFKNPEEWNDSIWTYEEMFPQFVNDVISLNWLQVYLVDNPEAEALFYDSY